MSKKFEEWQRRLTGFPGPSLKREIERAKISLEESGEKDSEEPLRDSQQIYSSDEG